MSSTLIAYATKHESTHEVADDVAAVLRDAGLEVDVRPAAAVTDIAPYEAVVLGGALYMGRLHKDARRFLDHHRAGLAQRPLFVFAMGPADLEEKSVASARTQLNRALGHIPELRPASTAIFGGVMNPAGLRFPFDRLPATDARDPEAIRAWALDVAVTVAGAPRTRARPSGWGADAQGSRNRSDDRTVASASESCGPIRTR